MPKSQIKSKERVAEHGEVFTNDREINAMLDMVKDESYNIESTFLEPACGDGNFLVVILERKLKAVEEKYGKTKADYEKYSLVALSSIYGVELMQDNCNDCIDRLYEIYEKTYKSHMKKEADEKVLESARYILTKNILCGDALTLLKNDGTPIIFAEWKFVSGSKVKRRDFALSRILDAETLTNEFIEDDPNQMSLFALADDDAKKDVYDSVNKPIAEFPLTDYKEIANYDR